MNIFDRIEINPRVCNGKPVIKGTRIPISVILELIAEGKSWQAYDGRLCRRPLGGVSE